MLNWQSPSSSCVTAYFQSLAASACMYWTTGQAEWLLLFSLTQFDSKFHFFKKKRNIRSKKAKRSSRRAPKNSGNLPQLYFFLSWSDKPKPQSRTSLCDEVFDQVQDSLQRPFEKLITRSDVIYNFCNRNQQRGNYLAIMQFNRALHTCRIT